MPPDRSTARSRELGRRLRELRQRAGIGTGEAAQRLGWSRPTQVRFETGSGPPSATQVGKMCDLYGAKDDARALLEQLSRDADKRGWWTAYDDVLTGSYIGDEALAERISTFEPSFVPGLLQTEQYAWAVIGERHPEDPDDVRRRVMARMARRTMLSGPDAPALNAIIDEAVLRRPVGGREAMRDQLGELLRQRPNVTVRVVPFAIGAYVGMEGPFTILDFSADSSLPTEVYGESICGDLYLESAEATARLSQVFERIAQAALDVDHSARLIRSVIEEDLGT